MINSISKSAEIEQTAWLIASAVLFISSGRDFLVAFLVCFNVLTTSTGNFQIAISPVTNRASTPSNIAFAISLTSARVGV